MSRWILYPSKTQLAWIEETGQDFNLYMGECKLYPAFTPYHDLFIQSHE